ncbi:MAG: tRNA uridine-5-carboxymethylaminomethyl(34) synthesis GTPase MnmE [Gemmatimonadaceae bacterium]
MIPDSGGDTIVALATPPGRGAVALVRISGDRALEIAAVHITPWPAVQRVATLCRLYGQADDDVLDQALVTVFAKPDSFTGEDIVEISTHGGQYTPARVMTALIASGARPALPGEFTRRAVLNGKLDITQAEAIGDLIDSRSSAMHRAAMIQFDGGLSRRMTSLREKILEVEALIAYDIDFPEEDDGPVPEHRIADAASGLLSSLDMLLATVPTGEIIREGAVVVIAGAPNAGKSSLFNAMLGQARAIVTSIPGTTRDAIEGQIETLNWPVRLVDTAGLRHTDDLLEKLGIEVSETYLARAHVVLACGDTEDSVEQTLEAVRNRSTATVICVRTKSDLPESNQSTTEAQAAIDASRRFVSAETGSGLAKLLQSIDEALTLTVGAPVAEHPVLMRTRHVEGIRRARDEIAMFTDVWKHQLLPAPVAAAHLRTAAFALEEMIGAVSTDDVLDRVFRSFCVGK